MPLNKNGVLVLCYHSVTDLSGDPILDQYGMPADAFAGQMDWLLKKGFSFISPDRFADYLEGSVEVPKNAVLLTFDDCYSELEAVARDILKPRGIAGIAFAVSGMASATNEWDQAIGARKLRLLNSAGLQSLSALGIEIGCHSRSHRRLPEVSDNELEQETRGAAEALAAMGLPRPRFFAFPHGRSDARVRRAVLRSGFFAAFGLTSRLASRNCDRFAIPRTEILARDDGWRFRLKARWPRMERLTRLRSITTGRVLRAATAVRRLAFARS